MAERITEIKRLKKSPEQIKNENLNEVLDAIAENKDSILKAIRLIHTLDEAKILDALNGGSVSYTHLTLPTICSV